MGDGNFCGVEGGDSLGMDKRDSMDLEERDTGEVREGGGLEGEEDNDFGVYGKFLGSVEGMEGTGVEAT